MKPRKLKLPSGTWLYLLASGVVTLWSPSGKRYRVGPTSTFTPARFGSGMYTR